MSITDELREYAGIFYLFRYKDVREKLDAIADRIDAAHHKAEDEWREKNGDMWLKGYAVCHEELMEGHPVIVADLENAGWVRLPVDADGVPIRIGDTLYDDCSERLHSLFEVEYMQLKKEGWTVVEKAGWCHYTNDCHHHHKPTVEDVLCELLDEYREGGCTLEEARLSEYADRLCLANEKEQQ